MTIGAIIRIKDDIEFLLRSIAYHTAIGVDYFLVCANDSSAESLAILEALANQTPHIHLFKRSLQRSAGIDVETMKRARLAVFEKMVEVFCPDWIFVPDVDELWVPGSDDLKTVVRGAGVDHLTVARFNAALPRDVDTRVFQGTPLLADLRQQEIIARRITNPLEVFEKDPALPRIFHRVVFHRVVPKFITRLKTVTLVQPGFHDLQATETYKRRTAENLLILHLPFTTLDRFAKKVDDIRRHLKHVGHTFAVQQAWTWKRWARKITDAESLRAEYDRQFFSSEELEYLRRQGIVMSIQDYLASHGETPTGLGVDADDEVDLDWKSLLGSQGSRVAPDSAL